MGFGTELGNGWMTRGPASGKGRIDFAPRRGATRIVRAIQTGRVSSRKEGKRDAGRG